MDDVITLVAETYTVDAIGQRVATETTRDVFAHVRSVSRAEWFNGGVNGLQPSLQADTPIINYAGEKIAIFHGVRYSIYRTYRREADDIIELYLEEKVGS